MDSKQHYLQLIDGLALQLRHTVQRFLNEQQWDDEDEAAMLASFRKISAFVSQMDMKTWGLWDTVLSVLTNHDGKAPQDVLDKSLMFLCLQLNWDLSRFVRDQDTNRNEAIKTLKKERDQFIHIIEGIISESAAGVELVGSSYCFFKQSNLGLPMPHRCPPHVQRTAGS